MSGTVSPLIDRRWRVVVISTHFDDAALSLGGFLLGITVPKAVVTVHGGAPESGTQLASWDRDCGFTTATEAHATRLAEDDRACAILGADQVALNNPDNPYRSGGPLIGLRELFASLDADVQVLLPLGINQPDHGVARDAALAALDSTGHRRVGMYADLPYAAALVTDWASAPAEALASELAAHDAGYRALLARYDLRISHSITLGPSEWSRKRDAVLCYASQLSLVGAMGEVRHMGALLGYPGAMQRELIWSVG
ncbi:PIG-L family deacetylase [Micromonospora sp. KC213]|uniref:PIG-L deacetylase family protein n=1 Tax=Micromonospora sp. KC213 TaxID=2530378 RepID=UPI0010437B81|nr:PIG-L family deacetylase [Micromonospora sp. KC213]TDC44269.1 PIG-L family deacetylase [Micromonospora sp. KC213]